MLVLSRRIGEEIVIDKQIRIVVAAVQGDRVRLGISAPPTMRVDRQEVHERRSQSPSSQGPGISRSRLSRRMTDVAGDCPAK
jgi:carbon storage regulator